MPPQPDCIFCQIAMGRATAQVVADVGDALAFTVLESAALAPGHVVVIPRRHCLGVQDADPTSRDAVGALCQRVTQGILRALPATGVNLLSACGPGSDQSVDHWHMHVVPRRAGDGIETWPESGSTAVGHRAAGELLEAELNNSTANGGGFTS
ncbi:HIT family protein [Pseudarthrobacter enclensis]|uniref:HIT family protein n=1 Tax=Micrococcaceae TaxID=1268 RepID=UPI0009ADC1FF